MWADSSGIITVSSPSDGSSDSGSSGIEISRQSAKFTSIPTSSTSSVGERRGRSAAITATRGNMIGSPGKNMNIMAKVQREVIHSQNSGHANNNNNNSSISSGSSQNNTVGTPLSSSSSTSKKIHHHHHHHHSSPLESSSTNEQSSSKLGKQQKTDLLTQVQAQMSQMMDQVQNEILHHQKSSSLGSNNNNTINNNNYNNNATTTFGASSPSGQYQMLSSSPGEVAVKPKRGRPTKGSERVNQEVGRGGAKSRPGRGRGRGKSLSSANTGLGMDNANTSSAPAISSSGTTIESTSLGNVMYQSQISGSNGLKMKIRKSPNHGKRGASSRGSGQRRAKYKRRKNGEDDEGDLTSDIDDESSSRVPSSSVDFLTSDASGNQSADSKKSGWGDQLPEDILFKMFSIVVQHEGSVPFLNRVSKVCRLWRNVATKPELWTTIDLTSPRIRDVYRSERNLAHLLDTRFFNAKHLNLGGWSSAVTTTTIDILVRRCKNLESLFLSSCQKLTGSNLKTITDACTSLRKLDLSAISAGYNTKSAVAPGSLSDAAEALGPRLTHLSVSNNCLPNCPQIINSLAEFCPNLEVLDLSNVTSPRRDTIVIRIELLQQGCPSMRILRLTNTEIALGETSLKDQASSPGFPHLEELNVPKGMDDSDLERIVKNSSKLRLLDVRGCTKISDSGLIRVPCRDLEHLYVSGCFATKSSNDGLELIVRKWKHSFKEIDFSWTPNEDAINLAIKALAEVDLGDKNPPIKKLDLCGSSVSFESIKVALSTCTNLTSLNLTSCRALPRGIKRNYPNPKDVATLREQVVSGKFDDE